MYRGYNKRAQFLLVYTKEAHANQLKKLGGSVNKGERACPVVFWKWYERQTDDTDEHGTPVVVRRPVLRFYRVFNTQQCRGIEDNVPGFNVVALGAHSENAIEASLENKDFDLFTVGDCVRPRDLMTAIQEGAEVARNI